MLSKVHDAAKHETSSKDKRTWICTITTLQVQVQIIY